MIIISYCTDSPWVGLIYPEGNTQLQYNKGVRHSGSPGHNSMPYSLLTAHVIYSMKGTGQCI